MTATQEVAYLEQLRKTLKEDIKAFLFNTQSERDKSWSTGFGTVCLAFTEAGNRIDKLNKRLGVR